MPANPLTRLIARRVARRLVHLRKYRAPELRVRVEGLAVSLSNTPDSQLDGNPGYYSLRFYESKFALGSLRTFIDLKKLGHATLGPSVSATSSGQVMRRVNSIESGNLSRAASGWISGWLGTEPKHFAGNIEITEINSKDGWALPSWLQRQFPENRDPFDTWVIHVHGRGANPAETARNFAQFFEMGFSNLSLSFRNDGLARHAGRVERGSLGLGTTEWVDLESAVAFASASGAQRVVVFGWSYGAAVSLQFAQHSNLAERVAAYIFDSPVISWRRTLEFQVAAAGAPKNWARLGEAYLANKPSAERLGLKSSIQFDDFETDRIAKHLATPTLLLHSVDDGFIPIEPCRELAEKIPSTVHLHEFDTARHCKLYNFDSAGYRKAIDDFVKLVSLTGLDTNN